MRERLGLHLVSLTTQMILSYIGLVLLTAVALGIPAIWLIRNQIEEQAWARLDQGGRATAALFVGWQGKVDNLAALTSQRPTLQTLLANEDQSALLDYLQILRTDTELDLLLVCSEGQPIAQAATPALSQAEGAVPPHICAAYQTAGYYNLAIPDENPAIWLLAGHNVIQQNKPLGQVIAGIALDQSFLQKMQAQTGLAHTLFPDGQPAVGGLTAGLVDSVSFTQNGRSYYAAPIPLTPAGAAPLNLADRAALDVTDIFATERNLMGILIGGIGLITLVGSALGLFLARRIGRPLAQLADAADVISQGELAQPITVRSGIRQVSQVAQALEQARSELQQTIHELRQAKAWTDHLLDSIVEGIVTLDDNGRITFFSPGAERITGWKQSKATGRTLDDICLIANSDEPFSRRLPAAGKRQKVTVQLAGRQATLAITGANLTAVGHNGPVLVLRDVTEGEVMHRLLGEFLANITHEFRTPLTALAVSAELLLEQAPELRPDELHELLTSLHLGILGLQTLIDNLLESARLEAGRFDIRPQPSDLGEMIAEAARIMQPLQGRYGHHLLVELPGTIPIVQADARRVVQVLVNLLSNAIKYSPDGSEIRLAVTAVPGEGDTAVSSWVKISVADRGPGVSTDFRAQAFQPFARSQTAGDSVHHGVGLGLSVVKAIVEAHGGQVGLADRPGGGSIFWFTLPIMNDE